MAKGTPKEVSALGQVLRAVQGLDETQKKWVFTSAMSNLGLQSTMTSSPDPRISTLGNAPVAVLRAADEMAPKQFLRAKNPQSGVQRVACLAYYLSHYRAQPHFKTKDLTALNVEAAGTKIGNPSQSVDNATKQSHYLAPAGKGNKQITAFGEEVVEALPDQDAVKAVEQRKPKKRKGGKRKAATKR